MLRLAAAAPRQQQHSQAHPRRHPVARGGETTADFRTSAAPVRNSAPALEAGGPPSARGILRTSDSAAIL